MSAGSVSTPTSTPRVVDRPRKPGPSVPTSSSDAAKPRPEPEPDFNPHYPTSKMPGIPNAKAIADAVNGHAEVTPGNGLGVVDRAMHGNRDYGPSRTTLEMRRDGSHVGARDARIGALEAERTQLNQLRSRYRERSVDLAEDVARVERELGDERALNAIADTLHVLGADDAVVDVLEDRERIRVVPDDELFGNAAYDGDGDQILVSQSLVDTAGAAARRLERSGVLDAQGRIVPGREDELDKLTDADVLIKIGTLLGVHEQLHAEQHASGAHEHEAERMSAAARAAMKQIERASMEGIPAVDLHGSYAVGDHAWSIEQSRVDAEEYDAYLAQEQADLALGAMVQIQLLTNVDGTPIARSKGVENIVDLERGQALRHGPDAGWLRRDVLEGYMRDAGVDPAAVPWDPTVIAAHGATTIGEVPGWKRPGWKRPAMEVPGWKRPGIATA
jgi:hypothetical protein